MNKTLFVYGKTNLSKTLKIFNINVFRFTEDKKNVSFLKANDIKNYGKEFSKEEVTKYLDPYGFLSNNPSEYKDTIEKDQSIKNDTLTKLNIKLTEDVPEIKKLEEIEKIQDPILKAEEKSKNMPKEFGYKFSGPEPTRYGDWDVKGKCTDF